MKFFVTNHCIKRYAQRVLNILHMKDVKVILADLYAAKDITNTVYDECPRFILFLYEKYKRANQKILKLDDKLFIAAKRPGTVDLYDVITMYKNSGNLEQFRNTSMKREDIFVKIKMIKSQIKN